MFSCTRATTAEQAHLVTSMDITPPSAPARATGGLPRLAEGGRMGPAEGGRAREADGGLALLVRPPETRTPAGA